MNDARIPNRALAGSELAKIIINDVQSILSRDGMFNSQIAYGRIHYEVKVSLHLGNPLYPEHVSTTLSRKYPKDKTDKDPSLGSIEDGPFKDDPEDAVVVSTTMESKIESPNAARVSNEMPLIQQVRENGMTVDKPVHYTGDIPDQQAVGNTSSMKDTSAEQAATWKVKGRAKREEEVKK